MSSSSTRILIGKKPNFLTFYLPVLYFKIWNLFSALCHIAQLSACPQWRSSMSSQGPVYLISAFSNSSWVLALESTFRAWWFCRSSTWKLPTHQLVPGKGQKLIYSQDHWTKPVWHFFIERQQFCIEWNKGKIKAKSLCVLTWSTASSLFCAGKSASFHFFFQCTLHAGPVF